MPAVMLIFAGYRWYLTALFFLLGVGNVLVEHIYASMKYPRLNALYNFFFGRMLRFEVQKGMWIISGGPYVFGSAFLSLLLFVLWIAAGGMNAMLLGDTAAALVGRKFGRHKTVNGKSLEGVFAFIAASVTGIAIVASAVGVPLKGNLLAILLASVAGCLAELFEKQLKIDDNFSIPVVVGAVLWLFV
jgi:dolichol kinase